MKSVLARGSIVVGLAVATGAGLGSRPGLAHNDWALPLVGGLVGGYGLSRFHQRQQEEQKELHSLTQEQPVYAAPAPAAAPPPPPAPTPAVPSATTIEDKLNTLDQLAAKGYITKSEYQARREALLNEL